MIFIHAIAQHIYCIYNMSCGFQLLHAKLESTREQLETKCKQTEVLDAINFDLERELAQQRRDSERDRQRIKE